MFTGLVEEKGVLRALGKAGDSLRLEVEAPNVSEGVLIGDSIAVNGCCLTVIEASEDRLKFDLLQETWDRTSFRDLGEGSQLNLERSLRADSRMGGHFVTGHIDGVCEVAVNETRGDNIYFQVKVPMDGSGYLVDKGCIAVEGVSLTVCDVTKDSFAVWLIPHTAEVTNLGAKQAGDKVNLEYDLLAKYVEKQMKLRE